MRLHEFADPKDYIDSYSDMRQLEKTLPAQRTNDPTDRPRKLLKARKAKLERL